MKRLFLYTKLFHVNTVKFYCSELINFQGVKLMAEIAILGLGTVGSGVLQVLNTNTLSIDKRAAQPVRVKRIFDMREFEEPAIKRVLTHDFNDILNDSDITVVVETMGGVEPSYSYVKKCLLKKKNVVTSNKELVAKHGAELLAIARENNLNFLFEASVGGGIPIIRPLNQSLTADEIEEIMGILNGTTNFILTKMTNEDRDFEDVLLEAQNLGYAEKDPTADVCGFDACRKIAILLSLAISSQVDFSDIHTEGIKNITKQDIAYAKKLNGVIKLVAKAKVSEHKVYARVTPVIISNEHPLAMVNDVFNAIFVKGNVIDEVMFYGKGAGKLPTASAVVADVIECVRNLGRNIMTFWSSEKTEVVSIEGDMVNKLVRIAYDNKNEAIAEVKGEFGNVKIVELDNAISEFAFFTGELLEKVISQKLNVLNNSRNVKSIVSTIRLQGVGNK